MNRTGNIVKTEIGSCEAKAQLPELLWQVRKGRSFTITNRGEAVAKLVPVRAAADLHASAAGANLRKLPAVSTSNSSELSRRTAGSGLRP